MIRAIMIIVTITEIFSLLMFFINLIRLYCIKKQWNWYKRDLGIYQYQNRCEAQLLFYTCLALCLGIFVICYWGIIIR